MSFAVKLIFKNVRHFWKSILLQNSFTNYLFFIYGAFTEGYYLVFFRFFFQFFLHLFFNDLAVKRGFMDLGEKNWKNPGKFLNFFAFYVIFHNFPIILDNRWLIKQNAMMLWTYYIIDRIQLCRTNFPHIKSVEY